MLDLNDTGNALPSYGGLPQLIPTSAPDPVPRLTPTPTVEPTVTAPSTSTTSYGSVGFTPTSTSGGTTSGGGTSTSTSTTTSAGGTYTIKSGGTTTTTETPAVAAPAPTPVAVDPPENTTATTATPVTVATETSSDTSSDQAAEVTADIPQQTSPEQNPDATAIPQDAEATVDTPQQTASEQNPDANAIPGAGTSLPGSQMGEDQRSDRANEVLASTGNEDQENNAGEAEGVDDGFPDSQTGEDNLSDAANEALAGGWDEGEDGDGSVMPDDVITPDDPVAEAGTEPTPGTGMHIVMPGDTLSDIAQYYGTDVDTLVRLNNVENRNLIHPGQVLQLPDGASAGAVGAGTDEDAGTYTVVVGDTLGDIAEKHGYGGDFMSLAKENNLANPNLILPGQKLKVGGSGLSDNTLPEPPSVVGYTDQR